MWFLRKVKFSFKHDGWQPGEAALIAEDVRKAAKRLHKCGNICCKNRPLKGSMFCDACLDVPRVHVVVILPKKISFLPLRRTIALLAGLERLTTAWFTQLEVMMHVECNKLLVNDR